MHSIEASFESEVHMPDSDTFHRIPRLGHERLDDDHDTMYALALDLSGGSVQHIPAAFDALHAHALEHFAIEDELMATTEFSSKECHIDEHAAVRKSFDEVRVAIQSGRPEVASRFAHQILAWLPEHADALDRHLTKLLFQKQTGGAPVLIHRRVA